MKTFLDRGAVLLSALAPACLAAAHLGNAAEAADDRGVARVLGWDPQPWRALDVAVGSLFALAPVGSLVARAALGGAAVLAVTGALVYGVARELLGRCAPAPHLASIVALMASLGVTLAPGFQREAVAPGGTVTGALLALSPLALLVAAEAASSSSGTGAALAALLALAFGTDPPVFACAMASTATLVAMSPPTRGLLAAAWRSDRRALLAGAALGLGPLLVALARSRAAGVSWLPALASGWSGEGGELSARHAELGTALPVLAVAGSVLAMLVARARPIAIALLAILGMGLASGWAGAPLGPTRFGAPLLAATAAAWILAGVALLGIVRWVTGTGLPFARASAAMILLLELALPVDEADESLVRGLAPSRARAAALWNDLAWGVLPPRSVVLVTDERLLTRSMAARAVGELRGDIAIVAAPGAGAGSVGPRMVGSDVALVPLWRDLLLSGLPGEASLSSLATARPVAMAYEPGWGRTLGRHLVPTALLDRFEPEPRGASDRRLALDTFLRPRERLASLVAGAGDRAERDPWLARATAYVLRARCLEVASSGDRNLVGRTVEELHAFAPDNPVAAQIVARVTLGRGAARVDDLRP